MKRINPDRGWQILEKHLSGIRDERRRAVLGCVVDHLRAEATAVLGVWLSAEDSDRPSWV